jgi:hypothetical protein
LFLKSDRASVVIGKCLAYLSEHLLESNIPRRSDVERGDAVVFQRPPTMRSTRATRKDAVCLCFSDAESDGLAKQGRYRTLLLGYDKDGAAVRIGAHRLVCWAVNGPCEEEKRKRRVTCHATENCPPSGACVNPLHLSFRTDKSNRVDRIVVQELFLSQATENLHSSQE